MERGAVVEEELAEGGRAGRGERAPAFCARHAVDARGGRGRRHDPSRAALPGLRRGERADRFDLTEDLWYDTRQAESSARGFCALWIVMRGARPHHHAGSYRAIARRASEDFHRVARTPRRAPRPTSPNMIRSSRVRASVSRFAASALVAFLLAAALPCAAAKKQKAPPARAVKSDLKYVRCQVCEEVAKVLSREASTLREEKGAKLTEADVLEKVEKVCDVETVEGEWLLKHDLVEKGDALAMVQHGRGRLRQVQLRVQDDAARVREDRR